MLKNPTEFAYTAIGTVLGLVASAGVIGAFFGIAWRVAKWFAN